MEHLDLSRQDLAKSSGSVTAAGCWRLVVRGYFLAGFTFSFALAVAFAPRLAAAEEMPLSDEAIRLTSRWVDQLSSPVFLEREEAQTKLANISDPALSGVILSVIAERWSKNPFEFRHQQEIWDAAWSHWLGDFRTLSEPSEVTFPGDGSHAETARWQSDPVSFDEGDLARILAVVLATHSGLEAEEALQMGTLIEVTPADAPVMPRAQEFPAPVASRLYRLAVAQTKTLPRVTALLTEKLSTSSDSKVIAHAELLLQHLRPVISAEIWTGSTRYWQNITAQFLIVGVPQFPEDGRTTTYFSSADGKTAHLENGNQLIPGDYLLNVAFPFNNVPTSPANANNPNLRIAAMSPPRAFYLAYLSNPKKKYAYEKYLASTSKQDRWAYNSRQTLNGWRASQRELNAADAWLLSQLDIEESRTYIFEQINKSGARVLAGPNWPLAGVRLDVALLRGLCDRSDLDTADALQSWLQNLAMDANKEVMHVGQRAWLSILANSTDIQADDRLVAAIHSPQELSTESNETWAQNQPPTLGASAAATLLTKHNVSPTLMGLTMTEYAPPSYQDEVRWQSSFDIYRPSITPRCCIATWSGGENAQARVETWWKRRRAYLDAHQKIP